MQPVRGVVQHYAWGDTAVIPELLGVAADGRPWAELWLGTHPSGPTTFVDGRALADVTGQLPYLLKVLAAAEPLSLQVHPNAEQAQAGFAAGRYPDAEPKPELLVALTPFAAFCGVRTVDDTIALLDELGASELAGAVRHDGPRGALTALYRRSIPVEPVVAACRTSGRPEALWAAKLAERYPHDPSVAVTLLLNLVELAPGQALQLGAGNLHAYLHGAGIELMGASDNVVRGGLTSKAVDVDDLLSVVDVSPLDEPVMTAGMVYPLEETSIRLLRLDGPTTRIATSHELVITSDGRTGYLPPATSLTLADGITAHLATTT